MRGTTKRLNLELDTQGALLVGFVGPAVDTAGRLQLARGMETSRLALAYTNRSVKRSGKGWMDRECIGLYGMKTYPLLIKSYDPGRKRYLFFETIHVFYFYGSVLRE